MANGYTNLEGAGQVLNRWRQQCPELHRLVCRRIMLEYELGNPEAAKPDIEQLLRWFSEPETSPAINLVIIGEMLFPRISRICGEELWLDVAESASRYHLAHWVRGSGIAATENLGLTAVVRGDRKMAGDQYRALFSVRAERGGQLSHTLGILAHTSGSIDTAIAHFEESYSFNKNAGYISELAWVCNDFADALAERDTDGDGQRGAILLEEGRVLASGLEMKPLLQRISERQGRIPGSVRRHFPDDLTKREVEVLRLIARGMTNQEIAYELAISIRTVTTHVRNIFEKIGLTNRVAVATYTVSKGLNTE